MRKENHQLARDWNVMRQAKRQEQARAIGMGERTPWGGFPKVIRNGDLGALQDEPEYQAGKARDKQAALDLVDRLLTDDTVHSIKDQIGERKPFVLPVLAVEATGNNKIPLAMAEVFADRLGLAGSYPNFYLCR